MRRAVARSSTANLLFGIVLIVVSTLGTASASSSASAQDLGPLGHWPSTGEVLTVGQPGSSFSIRLTFKLTESELGDLNRIAKFLEIDFHLSGFELPPQWEDYSILSDLPGAVHDVAFGDLWDQTPAVTGALVGLLVPEKWYHAAISFQAKPARGERQRVLINWVPSYWATENATISFAERASEHVYCYEIGRAAPPWCIFPYKADTYRLTETKFRDYGGWLPMDGIHTYRFSPNGASVESGQTGEVPRLLSAATRPGRIIQSDEGHLYVFAGSRLFWFDKNDAAQLAAFKEQSARLTGTTSYVPLHHEAVHAIEVNHDSSGAYHPGANMPADNTFLLEYGGPTQYVVKYQYPFPIGSPEEAVALGGQNRAIMVPRSIADLRTRSPHWVNNDLVRFWGDPTAWHYTDRGFRVPTSQVLDCLQARWNRGVTLMPQSAWNYFPTHPSQLAACDFSHGQWLVGEPSRRQIVVLYGVGHLVDYGEITALGGADKAQPIGDSTLNWLVGRTLDLPAHHLFRAANSPTVYMADGGQFHVVGSPPVRGCLTAKYGVVVETVPQSFIERLPKGSGAQCPYEGRQLLNPNGVTVDYVKNGQRHHVQNPTIRDCLIGRVGTSAPIPVEQWVWDSYTQGSDAHCPYELQSDLHFVTEAGSGGWVWLVEIDSHGIPIKHHVGSLCDNPNHRYELAVHEVPAGETAGHVQGSDWFASPQVCSALLS